MTPQPREQRPTAPRRVELLAPAGGLEAGLAAFQHGADAVYLGLKRFSARADAQNFTLEELDQLTGLARSLTPVRRVYVAVNTLVLDAELDALVETLGAVADVGPDALIVQDLGVARLARRHFPELELHASTQLAAHGSAAVETLRDLGFARVTLARELTLDEIGEAARVPGVEVETFLHGALCYAYSGLCLFSSHRVGRSGNRGQCAYPCRDRWEVEAVNGAAPRPGDGLRGGFAFSMKDLALPDHVGALREAGVACLKIEGRKKGPLYVAAAVDFYRRLLDGTLPAEERAAREADLQATFARPFTSLYLDSRLHKDVADRDWVGHRGTPVGTLQAVVRTGGGAAVRFRTSRPLSLHDGLQVEVPGLDRPFGFGVSALRVVAEPGGRGKVAGGGAAEVFEVPAGALVEVPLPAGYPLLPVGAAISCSSSQEVKQRYRLDRPNLGTHRVRREVRIAAEAGEDGLRLEAAADAAPGRPVTARLEVEGPLAAARDPARMEATARVAFDKLGDTRFRLAAFDWRDPAGRFVPVSRLNEARRELMAALGRAVAGQAGERLAAARAELEPAAAPPAGERVGWTVKVDRLATLDAFEASDFEGVDDVVVDLWREPSAGLAARLEALGERAGGRGRIRPGLPLIVRAWEERALRARVAALREAGFDRWELTNVASWALLGIAAGRTGGLDLTADSALHTVNHAAARQLMDMGVRRVTLSTEDSRENLARLLGQLGAAASVVVFEDSPLFLSESCPYATLRGGCPGPAKCDFETMELSSSHDGHGGGVQVLNERCRSVTIGLEPYNLSPHLAALVAAGARSLRVHFMHREYGAEDARAVWRAFRRSQVVRPGHSGSFARGAW